MSELKYKRRAIDVKTVGYLFKSYKWKLMKIVRLSICRVFIEAVATQFIPMMIIGNGVSNIKFFYVLIVIDILLCGVDVLILPRLSKSAELEAVRLCNVFRSDALRRFITNNKDANLTEEFKAKLLLTMEHLNNLLQEDVVQLSYRLIYGGGAFIAVIILDPKAFVVIFVIGIILSLVRIWAQPHLDKLYIERANAKAAVLECFSILLGNQYTYVNTEIAERAFKVYEKTDSKRVEKSNAILQMRGKIQIMIASVCELILIALILLATLRDLNNWAILFAVRPMINFFNYINITVSSVKEDLGIISDYIEFERGDLIGDEVLNAVVQQKLPRDRTIKGIEVCNISVEYNQRTILNNFTYKFYYGNMYEIRGVRGVGKTTLLKVIYNIIRPLTGYVLIDGVPNTSFKEIGKKLFYLPSAPEAFLLDVENNILLGEKRPTNFEKIVYDIGLNLGSNYASNNYSTGEKTRIALARGLISHRKIYLIDEFNANLDKTNSDRIIGALYKKVKEGALVILVNHKEKIPGAIKIELKEQYVEK